MLHQEVVQGVPNRLALIPVAATADQNSEPCPLHPSLLSWGHADTVSTFARLWPRLLPTILKAWMHGRRSAVMTRSNVCSVMELAPILRGAIRRALVEQSSKIAP